MVTNFKSFPSTALVSLAAHNRVLSLYLRQVKCIDETEHEGISPFVGEGIANDAIRLRALITSQQGAGAGQIQGLSPVMDLGSNYQDGTVILFNQRLAAFPLLPSGLYPLTVNAALTLIEEDWGGQMEEVSAATLRSIGDFVKGEVATATATAVTTAVGGAIGTAFGPLGTVVGAGIGAAIGFIVQQIGAGLDALKSDAFSPQDVSIVLANADARFTRGSRLPQILVFEGFGGKYEVTCEWRIGSPDRRVALRTYNNSYVMAVNGGGGLVNAVSRQPSPREWETFTLEDITAGQISLKSYDGKTLGMEGVSLAADRGLVGASETFSLRRISGDKVAILGPNRRYLSAINGGGSELQFVREERHGVAEWETFTLQTL